METVCGLAVKETLRQQEPPKGFFQLWSKRRMCTQTVKNLQAAASVRALEGKAEGAELGRSLGPAGSHQQLLKHLQGPASSWH